MGPNEEWLALTARLDPLQEHLDAKGYHYGIHLMMNTWGKKRKEIKKEMKNRINIYDGDDPNFIQETRGKSDTNYADSPPPLFPL